MRPSIFVTQPIPGKALARLREVARVDLPNVVLSPHLGSAALDTRERVADIVVDNIMAVVEGRRPPNLYNPEIYGS